MLEMQTRREKDNFLMSYFQIWGIWIKMKTMKEISYIFGAKEAKNYRDLLHGHVNMEVVVENLGREVFPLNSQ